MEAILDVLFGQLRVVLVVGHEYKEEGTVL